jgi:Cys-rich protein (TIGR01571 family)
VESGHDASAWARARDPATFLSPPGTSRQPAPVPLYLSRPFRLGNGPRGLDAGVEAWKHIPKTKGLRTRCCRVRLRGLAGLPSLLGALFGLPVGGVFGWAIHLGTRGAIRNMHNIPGGCCEDCLVAACCESCAIVQEEYQLLPPQVPTILVAPVVQMVQPVVMQPVTMQPATMAQPSMMAQPSIGMPSTMAPPIPVAQAPPIYFSNSMAQAAPMKY